MNTYPPENSQENSKKSTKKTNPSEKTNSPLIMKKTHISAQWNKYSKTKKVTKTTQKSHIGQKTAKHAQNTNNAMVKDFLEQ